MQEETSCTKINTLLERRAAEEPLSTEEQAALDAHLGTCQDCRDFARIVFGLHHVADNSSAEMIAIKAANARRAYFASRRRTRIAAVGAFTAASAAAILITLLATSTAQQESASLEPYRPCEASEAESPLPGIWTVHCAGDTVQSTITADGLLLLSLNRGAVGISADPNRPNKRPAAVKTPFGEVRVKGTVLTVHVDDDDAKVEVYRGIVAVTPYGSGTAFEVSEGHAGTLDGMNAFLLKNRRGEVLRRKLAAIPKLPFETPPANDDKTAASDRAASDAGVEISTTAPPDINPKPKVRKSLGTLIQEAQSCMIALDWHCAADRYRTIMREYPGRQEAASALISLAKLELRQLRHPGRALRYFKTYQARHAGGPLSEEAYFGEAECYRKQGDTKKELESLRNFLHRFPNSASAAKAERRLKELTSV